MLAASAGAVAFTFSLRLHWSMLLRAGFAFSIAVFWLVLLVLTLSLHRVPATGQLATRLSFRRQS